MKRQRRRWSDLADATVVQITDEVLVRSIRLLEAYPLRGSDALQIASAMVGLRTNLSPQTPAKPRRQNLQDWMLSGCTKSETDMNEEVQAMAPQPRRGIRILHACAKPQSIYSCRG
jgi:hypothetical protein